MHRATHKGTNEVWFYYMRSLEEVESQGQKHREESWKPEIRRLYLVTKGPVWEAEKVLEVQSGDTECWMFLAALGSKILNGGWSEWQCCEMLFWWVTFVYVVEDLF